MTIRSQHYYLLHKVSEGFDFLLHIAAVSFTSKEFLYECLLHNADEIHDFPLHYAMER